VNKVKLCDVIFKCAVLMPERSEILQKAVFAAGGEWGKELDRTETDGQRITHKGRPFAYFNGGRYPGLFANNDVRIFICDDRPELTLQQALDLLATVEKPEPVFDIKLDDKILCRDSSNAPWEVKIFARTLKNIEFLTYSVPYRKMIKFAGNEQYHGTTNTPSGWWEAKDGKPVWITK